MLGVLALCLSRRTVDKQNKALRTLLTSPVFVSSCGLAFNVMFPPTGMINWINEGQKQTNKKHIGALSSSNEEAVDFDDKNRINGNASKLKRKKYA